MEDDAPCSPIVGNISNMDLGIGEEDRWSGESDDEWEEGSTLSEIGEEVLLEEDEDDVVPASFSLSLTTQPTDIDVSTTDGVLAAPPAHMSENEALGSRIVYGSNSKHAI